MDFSKFKTSDWLMVGGGLGFLIFGTFESWASLEGFDISVNAFDFFFRGTIPWILIVGVGVLAFLLAGGILKRGTAPWPLILLAAAGLGTLLVLLLVLMGPEKFDTDLDRGVGLWLSFVAAIVALVGAVLNFQATGGRLSDLTDMDKMRSSFDRPASTGVAPPPPPPPAAPAPPLSGIHISDPTRLQLILFSRLWV